MKHDRWMTIMLPPEEHMRLKILSARMKKPMWKLISEGLPKEDYHASEMRFKFRF